MKPSFDETLHKLPLTFVPVRICYRCSYSTVYGFG